MNLDFKSNLIYSSRESVNKIPFLSVCLCAYCFEKTICRALDSLLNQTYDNFEIIISDDCSPDNTIEVVVEHLKRYTGPIHVSVYRSAQNKGIVLNRLTAMTYARGELFFQTDGDDFSMPYRLEKIVQTWQALPNKPSILATNAIRYFERNEMFGSVVIDNPKSLTFYPPGDPVYGHAVAFSAGFVIARKLFEDFKEIIPPKGLIADDPVFARRAALCQGMYFLPDPLFYYGSSVNSASGGGVSGRNWIEDRLKRWDLLLLDIKNVCREDEVFNISKKIYHERRKMLVDIKAIDCSNYVWPIYFLRMLFLSPRESLAMAKKRIKLILRGSVNSF